MIGDPSTTSAFLTSAFLPPHVANPGDNVSDESVSHGASTGKHNSHTCGKGRQKKKQKQSTPLDGETLGEPDDDVDTARNDGKDERKDESRDEAKTRPVRRSLRPIPQIGLGHVRDAQPSQTAGCGRCR